MPWKETCVMDQRIQFIGDWLKGEYSKSALCRDYGISRPTGDKWIARYEAEGIKGLQERSRAAISHPNATPEWVKERIIGAKLAHLQWGPKKVMDSLRRETAEVDWPADSTAGEILKRAGLVRCRKRHRRVAADPRPFAGCDRSNRTWSTDFKGPFRVGDGRWCYPLTLTDNYSRYLLACRGLNRPGSREVWPWFVWAFREYGLPEAIRTDNGAPFASLALGGISQLSKWWIRLGIRPERIQPGKPSQNGRHERMHRSLKEATAQPPRRSLLAQQRAFNHFVREYNEERSHEALQRRTPASVYRASERPYPVRLRPVEYDASHTVRRVRHNGEIRWKGQLLYVSGVLAGEPIGLRQRDENRWDVYFSFCLLGTLDEVSGKIEPIRHWHGTRR